MRSLPRPLGTATRVVVPFMRELRETRHQFEREFVLDSTLTEQTFGLAPTPWDEALDDDDRRPPAGRPPRPRRPDVLASLHLRGPQRMTATAIRGIRRRCDRPGRQCDCWRIRLVSSVTWLDHTALVISSRILRSARIMVVWSRPRKLWSILGSEYVCQLPAEVHGDLGRAVTSWREREDPHRSSMLTA